MTDTKRRAFLRTVKAGDKVDVLTEVEVVVRLRSGLVLRTHREKQFVGAIYKEHGNSHSGHIVEIGTTTMWVLTKDMFPQNVDD